MIYEVFQGVPIYECDPDKNKDCEKLSAFLTSTPKDKNAIVVYLLIMNGTERKQGK